FTPAGGVMMGTRSGDLDPGVLVHLVEERGYDADALRRLVDFESGLLGVSGLTSDMQTLLERRRAEPAGPAALAVQMFCRRLRMQVGAYAAELGGLSALVFTGGIGEHSAQVRAEVCAGLDHLGIVLDPARNGAHAAVISWDGAGCAVRVVPADEESTIARHTWAVLAAD
ncbi:MAG TPA: acetate/propionate family kinase, partial [Frankiaceae bacterium]|nr:acetate/propionate family kinase [Frankiaceae bacterium]